jgi:hypothetical protein
MAIVIPVISTFDSKGVTKAISSLKQLDGAGQKSAFALLNGTKAINSVGKSVIKTGSMIGGVAGVIGGSLIKAARESEKVSKQTEAIIKATGGSAKLSTEQISDMAQAMSNKTGIDDEAIQSSMNLILTFKQVRNEVGLGNDVFTRASQAALDLGNVFGSTDGAAKQLGKALSDPVKGISALRKAGINFTDAQKEQIKTLVESGNTLEAQKLILKEVESQVGGTAAATATDFDRMKVAVGNVAEDLGTLLLPAFEAAARFVTEKLVPIFKQFSDIIGEKGLGAGFKFLGTQGLDALGKLKGWGALVYGVVAAVVALNVAVGIYTALQTIANIAMAAFGTSATITAIATNAAFFGIPALIGLIVVGLVALALKFKGFRELMVGIGKTLFTVFKTIGNFFFDNVVNPLVRGINVLIKAFNSLPLLGDIPLLGELQIGSDQAVKGLKKVASAADFRKFEGFNPGAPKSLSSGGGGGGGGTSTQQATLEKARVAMEKYSSALELFGRETKNYKDAVKGVADANLTLTGATDNVRVAQEAFNKVSKGYGATSKEAVEATKNLTTAQRDAVKSGYALKDAQNAVLSAQKKLQNLLTPASVRSVQEATDDLTQANFDVIDAQDELAKAQKDGTPREVTEAQIKLRDAMNGASDAQEKLTNLQKAADPADIIQAQDDLAIAQLGVKDALDDQKQALDDVDAAQTTLNRTINGFPAESQEYIDSLADLKQAQKEEVSAIDAVADAKYREFEATKALTKANLLLIKSKGKLTAKQIAKVEKEAESLTYTPEVAPVVAVTPSFDFSGFDFSGIDLSGLDFSGFSVGGIATLATGGIVNKPTLAMIAEGGEPEAVIPLSKLGGMGGDVYNITINSKIADQTLPDVLVAELRKFNRRSGAINIQVA